MTIKKIGKTKEDLEAESLVKCRQIVKNIVNFGVSESEKLQLIYLLSLEFESRETLEIICKAVKNARKSNINATFSLTEESLKYNDDVEQKTKPKLINT